MSGIYLEIFNTALDRERDNPNKGTVRYVHRKPLATSGGREVYGDVRVDDGNEHHVAAVMSDTEMVLYLDGKPFSAPLKHGQSTHDPEKMPKPLRVIIGQLGHDHFQRPFIGEITKLQVWPRAKTRDEILAASGQLLAEYPLTGSNPYQDSTGNNNPMRDLYNSKWADINNFNWNNFTISVEFKSDQKDQVVFALGDNLAVAVMTHSNIAGRLTFRAAGTPGVGVESSEDYTINQWHTATVTYDGTTGKFYLDGNLSAQANFTIVQSTHSIVGFSHPGHPDTTAFSGEHRNLRVYEGIYVH